MLTLKDKLTKIDQQQIAEQLNVGLPTLEDIIAALIAPNRDPRDNYETPILKSDVLSIEDLTEENKKNIVSINKKWGDLTDEIQSSAKIKQIFDYRRQVASKKINGKTPSFTFRVLRFLRSSYTRIDEIQSLKCIRDNRARLRAKGFVIATQ